MVTSYCEKQLMFTAENTHTHYITSMTFKQIFLQISFLHNLLHISHEYKQFQQNIIYQHPVALVF
jgi:hypothetical protein